MKIGKYVTNPGILGSLAGAYGVSKQSKEMSKDWRKYILWTVWLLGVVLAIAAVRQEDDDSVQ